MTEEQIIAGYSALKNIENFIKKKNFSSGFMKAIDDYYTKIPHFFGFIYFVFFQEYSFDHLFKLASLAGLSNEPFLPRIWR